MRIWTTRELAYAARWTESDYRLALEWARERALTRVGNSYAWREQDVAAFQRDLESYAENPLGEDDDACEDCGASDCGGAVGYEHLAIDFKSNMPDAGFELAKDVAALANAAGGTLIHRAHEDRSRNVVGAYDPLSESEAARVCDAYDRSVRDRCFPAPAFSSDRIAVDGGVIVAINVQPFPGAVVGVKILGDASDGYGAEAFAFPIRVGPHTRFLKPGELAMYMVPEVRMNAIALESIPEPERESVTLIQRIRDERMSPREVRLVSVEPERNSVRLGGQSYPINRVLAVWHNGTRWCVLVDFYDMA